MNKFKSVQQSLGFLGLEGLIQRTWFMGVQVVHYQRDFFGITVLSCNLFKKPCPVLLLPVGGHPYDTIAHQRFCCYENVAYSFTAVLIIGTCQLPLCVNIDVSSTEEANYGIFPSSEVKCAEKSLAA